MVALIRLGAAAILLSAVTAFAQTEHRSAEIRIKAVFLYKFGGFVEWPAGAFARTDSPFSIGVIGADALAAELEGIVSGRTVQGRAVTVRKLRRGESLAGLQVLFVGQSEGPRLAEILSAAKDQPLLVVTESEGALARGSVINFVAVDNKVRFDVALPQAERGQLKISARLLSVARKVITG